MHMPQTKGSFILSLRKTRTGASWSAGGSSSPELSPGSNAGLTSLDAGRAASWTHMGAAVCFCLTHRAEGVLERHEPKQSMHLCCTSLCEGRKLWYQVLFMFMSRWACVVARARSFPKHGVVMPISACTAFYQATWELLLSPPLSLLLSEQVGAATWLGTEAIPSA